jgi:hypothetical protein
MRGVLVHFVYFVAALLVSYFFLADWDTPQMRLYFALPFDPLC